jgi:hypothetical protein
MIPVKTALFPLQQSLWNRLTTHENLKEKITGVFDAVPKDQEFPYVSLGEDTVTDWSTKTEAGESITHTLHVWSRYEGKKEAKEIMSLILEALAQPLLLEGGFFVEVSRVEMMNVLEDPDLITRHGVMRLRFNISQ